MMNVQYTDWSTLISGLHFGVKTREVSNGTVHTHFLVVVHEVLSSQR
jgi:hypothetical protein